MDPKNFADKRIIIQQVLNYGDWEQLKWLSKTYSKREIKYEIKRARRGVWLQKNLDYWLDIFQIKLPEVKYEKALFNLNPRPELWPK